MECIHQSTFSQHERNLCMKIQKVQNTKSQRSALDKMNGNKAAGPDVIVTEILSDFDNFGINKIKGVINKIYII